jgi:hypothetical protein
MDAGWPGEWEAPTREIAEEAQQAAEATVPPPQEEDTSCDVWMWTGPMRCSCTAHTKRGGDRKARYWHTLNGYIQSNGKPYAYNQIMVSWTWNNGVRVPIGGPLVPIGAEGAYPLMEGALVPQEDRKVGWGPTEYVLPFRHPLEVTVQLKKHKNGAPDAVMRPCRDCYQRLMEIGIQRNVRLPSSDREPSLLEQLAEFHMAVTFNAGGRISYEECVAIVKREHPKWKKYREQLALDTSDMSLEALRARREYYQAKLKQVESAIDAAETVIVNHVVS